MHEINKQCVNKPRQNIKEKANAEIIGKKQALCKQIALDEASNSFR